MSVDWNYFFPDSSKFKWDLRIYFDFIWHVRFSSQFTINHERFIAREYFNAHLYHKRFFDFVLINSNPRLVVIEENHEKISDLISKYEEVNIYSFSRLKYNHFNSEKIKNVECFEPKWKIDGLVNQQLASSLRKNYPNFEVVFVCRSPNRTSSWNDPKWIEFINILGYNCHCEFQVNPSVKNERWFDIKLANQLLLDKSDYYENRKKKLMAYHYENVVREI